MGRTRATRRRYAGECKLVWSTVITYWPGLTRYAQIYAENKQYLTELDSAIGDADHGINMDRGFTAVKADLEKANPADISAILKTVAMTLIRTVGGAAGPLYGTFFMRASSHLRQQRPN